MNQSRNEKCSCGSGKKYKNCCMNKSGTSFLRRYSYVFILFMVMSVSAYVIFDLYGRYQRSGPTNEYDVFCLDCNKYVAGDNPDTPINELRPNHRIKCDICKKVGNSQDHFDCYKK